MIIIDTKAYIIRLILDIFIFYFLFFSLNKRYFNKKFFLKVSFIIIITFFLQLFSGLADIITVFLSYLTFKSKEKKDLIVIDKLILCKLLEYLTSLISSVIMVYIGVHFDDKGYSYVFLQEIIKLILLFIFITMWRKLSIDSFYEKFRSKNSSFFTIYLFLVSLLITYAARYYQIFDQFILGIILFLIIQTGFVGYFFIRVSLKQKETYEAYTKEQELIHLKQYTDKLENNQEKLSKFKHDYKNLLLSLKSLSIQNLDEELLEQINQLETYSKKYIDTGFFEYKYFCNIHNSYLKSLLISKFYKADTENIQCRFECLECIDKIPIPIFDCVRILGIILDNAIESAKECERKNLSMMIHQDHSQLEFLIENSCLDLSLSINELTNKCVSTKLNHQGLGLNTIKDINKSNDNMFIQYTKKETIFSTQIILVWK